MQSITIKVEDAFAKEIDLALNPDYSTKTEFIREAIRDKIALIRRERIIRTVWGSAQKKVSDKSLRQTREAVGKEYLEKYGLQ
jgi:metal-responsive CopG/Arc/MetJ family transcriptional regulator